jgi:type VI secretion system secreted protein Hcp
MPLPIHLELVGSMQGPILGSCDMAGREGTILAYNFDYAVKHAKVDYAYQSSSGRIHERVRILKEVDDSSTSLFRACCELETLTCTFRFYRTTKEGKEENHYSILLERATITHFKTYTPTVFLKKNEPYRHMEYVHFNFRNITLQNEINGALFQDSWKLHDK